MASPGTPDVFVLQGKNYVIEKTLGQGAFGKVYKVRENGRSGSVYALKKIKVENNEAVNMARKEIGILEQCSHDQIVRLYRVDTTTALRSTYVLILMEYCEGGNLNSRLARPSDSDTNLRWMRELADAMYYLHSKNIVHRDLKPENVLLTGGSIKLGDFGLAREYAVLRQHGATRSDETLVSYLNQVYMGTALGKPAWMAPEVFTGHYTESADIFALGTIMYAIPTRACMSVGGQTYYGAFVNVSGDRIGLGMAMRRNPKVMVPLDGLSSSTARQVLRSVLDYNPKNRPSARKVVQKMNSILDLHYSLPPRSQPTYLADNVPLYQESPLRQNPFSPHGPSPQPPSPNFIRPCHSPPRHSPFIPNSPYYPQAGPPQHRSPSTPRYGAPSPRIISPSPQPTRGVFPTHTHPSPRRPFRNTPTHGFPIRHVPSYTPSTVFIRSPIHIRIHSPARMSRPRHFAPRHTFHRFR